MFPFKIQCRQAIAIRAFRTRKEFVNIICLPWLMVVNPILNASSSRTHFDLNDFVKIQNWRFRWEQKTQATYFFCKARSLLNYTFWFWNNLLPHQMLDLPGASCSWFVRDACPATPHPSGFWSSRGILRTINVHQRKTLFRTKQMKEFISEACAPISVDTL